MRHDVIHDMACVCPRCLPAATQSAIEIAEMTSAFKKGAYVGLWVAGLLCAREFGPAVLDWIGS